MAHHQGMSLLAINNFLNRNIMQKRFHADPAIHSARLLLQEKVPANIVFTKDTKEKVIPYTVAVSKEKSAIRRFGLPDPVLAQGPYLVQWQLFDHDHRPRDRIQQKQNGRGDPMARRQHPGSLRDVLLSAQC